MDGSTLGKFPLKLGFAQTNRRYRDVEDIWKDHFDYFYREYG